MAEQIDNRPEIKEIIQSLKQTEPDLISLPSEKIINKEILKQQNLMLISVDSWKTLVDTKTLWLSDVPSLLILSDKWRGTRSLTLYKK